MSIGIYPHPTGEKASHWKGGKPKCVTCGKQLTCYGRMNCMKHRPSNSKGKTWKLSLSKQELDRRTERMRVIGSAKRFGAENPAWKGGLEFRKRKEDRRDSMYNEWRRQVWIRDNFKCKIANQDCEGRIEAHHILGWSEHVELRYEVNNGITLCHAHHPRVRTEEKRLQSEFQALVSASKATI